MRAHPLEVAQAHRYGSQNLQAADLHGAKGQVGFGAGQLCSRHASRPA